MFNFRDIIKNNNATFYDFETRKRRSQKIRVVIFISIAAIASVTMPKVSDNFLSGILAIQAILLGFTINIMFFLLSNKYENSTNFKSIEEKLRSKRLNNLYHELFYNVSYFNFISIISIIIATSLLLPTPEVPEFIQEFTQVESYLHWLNTSKTPIVVSTIMRTVAMFAFYAVSIEIVFSIARVIGRTSFYFERKMGEVRLPDDQE